VRTTLITLAALLVAACSTTKPIDPVSTDPARTPVATERPFEVEGTIQGVGGEGLLGMEADTVTIARDGAPAARLHVAEKTQILLDDRPVKLSDLREGDEVRASFDFDGDRPIAIQIVAEPRKR
jgi:hypothetical protein